MIRAEKHDQALAAMNIVLVQARAMAAAQVPYEELVAILDVAEYLPTLFLRREDMTDHYRDMLVDLLNKHSVMGLALERFDKQ